MNFDRVTITGADQSVRPSHLLELTRKFPFVEWGILVSRSQAGNYRYPDEHWIRNLQQVAATNPELNLSLHVCGHWVRQLLLGENEVPAWMLEDFKRVQLNFHSQVDRRETPLFFAALAALGNRQVIFQIDSALGAKHLESVYGENDEGSVDAVPLFDLSSGTGVLPVSWPAPRYMQDDVNFAYHGYAGGLGPDNLADEIPKIAQAAAGARFWIDMETHVRSANDRQFDLGKVERCLELAALHISHANLARSPVQV
jgi:hypothetical protein